MGGGPRDMGLDEALEAVAAAEAAARRGNGGHQGAPARCRRHMVASHVLVSGTADTVSRSNPG